MAQVKGATLAGALAACLPLAALLAACSQSAPPPRDFILVGQPQAKTEEAGNTLDVATLASGPASPSRTTSPACGSAAMRSANKGAADSPQKAVIPV